MPPEPTHPLHAQPPAGQSPVIGPGQTYDSVTEKISATVLVRRTSWAWLAGFGLALLLMMLLVAATGYLLVAGVGIWGLNIPVAWGFAIINFVWWIGIAHAATLISASLLLVEQPWRRSISRFTETIALGAVVCAGLFPLLHLGRPWFFYWLLPYPNTMDLWPQFRSALVWDLFALLAYLLVVLLFWYLSLVPDLAVLRDRVRSRRVGRVYAILALGWRGDVQHWRRHQIAYRLLAALAVLLVLVHSAVGFAFAITVVPGWHWTIFPPHFVAGAIHSGTAMLLLLVIPLRRIYALHAFITERHLQNLAKLLVATSLLVGYGYLMEIFTAWYGDSQAQWHLVLLRIFGPYAAAYWAMLACNIAVPQVFWFRRPRSSSVLLWTAGLLVLAGVWLERNLIVHSSLHRDYLPSAWGPYSATFWDWAMFLGTFGLFFVLLLAFVRLLPMISMSEVRKLVTDSGEITRPASWPQQVVPSDVAIYGLLAEFDSPTDLAEAVHCARARGYKKLEAYSPLPAREVERALGVRRSWLPALVLLGGLTGASAGYLMQYYLNAVDYPINVGGRPLNSWPLFVVITLEMAVVLGALAAVLGMLVANGLPRLYHPVFNVPQFSLASGNRFFLCVRADDAHFNSERTWRLLAELRPLGLWEAPS